MDIGVIGQEDELLLSQLWATYKELNVSNSEWFLNDNIVNAFVDFSSLFLSLFTSSEVMFKDSSQDSLTDLISNLTAHVSSLCVNLNNRIDKSNWTRGGFKVIGECGLPINVSEDTKGEKPSKIILFVLRTFGTVLHLPQFLASNIVRVNGHKVLGQSLLNLQMICNELLPQLESMPNSQNNSDEYQFGQSVYFLLLKIMLGLLPRQSCLGLSAHPWRDEALKALKLGCSQQNNQSPIEYSDIASLVPICAPLISDIAPPLQSRSVGTLERSYVFEWMLSNHLMKLLLEVMNRKYSSIFICCIQADIASIVHSAIYHVVPSLAQRSAHEFEVAGGPLAALTLVCRGVEGVEQSPEFRLASIERFSTALAALSAWIELDMSGGDVESLSNVLHDLVTKDVPEAIFELIAIIKTLETNKMGNASIEVSCQEGSLPYELAPHPSNGSAFMGHGARVLSVVFNSLSVFALSELPLASPLSNSSPEKAAKVEMSKKWYEIGSLFSSRQTPSETSSSHSFAEEGKHGLLKIVLETLVNFVEFQPHEGEGTNHHTSEALLKAPLLEWCVLLTVEKILNALPLDANVAATQAQVWQMLLGMRYLRGGPIVEFESPYETMISLYASCSQVQLGWCQLHDRSLRVLHAAALGAGQETKQSLVYMVARSLGEHQSGNLAILRVARWLSAVTIPRTGSSSASTTQPRRSSLPPLPAEWMDTVAEDATAIIARSSLAALDFVEKGNNLRRAASDALLFLLNELATGSKAENVCSLVCSRALGSIEMSWPPVLPRLDMIMTLCLEEFSAPKALKLLQTLLIHCAWSLSADKKSKAMRSDFAAKRGRAIALRLIEGVVSACSAAVNNATNYDGLLTEDSSFEESQEKRMNAAFTMIRWLRVLICRNDVVGGVGEPVQLLFRQVGIIRTFVSLLFLLADTAKDTNQFLEVKLLAFNVLNCCMGCMRNTGLKRIGDLNKESFRVALLHESKARTEQSKVNRFDTPVSNVSISSSSIAFYPLYALLLRLELGQPSCELIAVVLDMVFDDSVLSEGIIRGSPNSLSSGTDSYRHWINNVTKGVLGGRTMQHADMIPLLFLLLPYCVESTQIDTLEAFNWLLTAQEYMNTPRGHQVACGMVQPSVLTVLLDIFPRLQQGQAQYAAIALTTTLGRHSVTVAQLKRIFRLMNTKNGFRPAYSWRLVKALHEMATDRVGGEGAMLPSPAAADFKRVWRRRGPHRHFLLDGRDSGLKLPLMPRWPASKGYAFSTWFRVEGSSSGNESTISSGRRRLPYHPYIFSFRCRGGNGVELFLKQAKTPGHYTLAITVHSKAKGSFTKDLGMSTVFMEGQWRFVALSHVRSQFRTVSSVDVVVDDHHISVELSFPRFDNNVRGFIGRRGGSPSGGPSPSDGEGFDETWSTGAIATSTSVFRGQMGAVYVFNEPLPVDKLHSLYRLGPNYTYFFERADTDLRHHDDDSADLKPANECALDGSLTSLIMLAFNPAVYKGDAFLDNTPEKNGVNWGSFTSNPFAWVGIGSSGSNGSGSVFRDMAVRPAAGHMHALRLPGTVECVTRDVRNTLDCLGGVKVLFPLFAQFDQPTQELEDEDTPNFDSEPKLGEWVLNLLGTLVDRRSAANESFLHQQHGWPLVTFFLKRVSPQHLTIASLKAMRRLTGCGKWSENVAHSNSSDLATRSFPDSAVAHLLGNWALWVFADHKVQLLMSVELRDMAKNSGHQLALPVQSVLDAMVLHFWYISPTSLLDEYEFIDDYPVPTKEKFENKSSSPNKKKAGSGDSSSNSETSNILRIPSSLSLSNSGLSSASSAPVHRRGLSAATSWSVGDKSSVSSPKPILEVLPPRRAKPSRAAVKKLIKPLLALESIHPSTGKVDGTRAPKDMVKDIRNNLWATMESQLVNGKLSQHELCCILSFCLRGDENTSREEGLVTLLRLTRNGGQCCELVVALKSLSMEQNTSGIGVKGINSGALLLLELLRPCHSSMIRVGSFLLIVRALGAIFGTQEDSEEPKIDASSPLYSLFGADAPTRRLILSWASRQLAASNDTVDEAATISEGLIEVLVGGNGGALGGRWIGSPGNGVDNLLIEETVVVPEALGALCVHLSRRTLGSANRGRLLQRVKDLTSTIENREAILAEPNWQSSVLYIACSALQYAEDVSADDEGLSDAVREVRSSEVVVSMVGNLVFHALTNWYRKAAEPPPLESVESTAAVEVEARIMNINLLAGVEEKVETPIEQTTPIISGGELDEVLATLQVLARPSEHRMGNAAPSSEHQSISEQQVGCAIANRVGFDILMGVVQRLRQEMELLVSRRGQWFDGGQLNSPAAWDSTVAVVWHTVRSALSFLVIPVDRGGSRTCLERVVTSMSSPLLPEPLSPTPERPIEIVTEGGVQIDFQPDVEFSGVTIPIEMNRESTQDSVVQNLRFRDDSSDRVEAPSISPLSPPSARYTEERSSFEVPTWRTMETVEDSKEATTNAVTAAWRVIEALVDIITNVDIEQGESEDSRPTMLASMSSSGSDGIATIFSDTRHCFLGGLLPRLPSTQCDEPIVEAVPVIEPSPIRPRRRRASSSEPLETAEEKASWLSEKPLHLVEPTHTLIPWAFCRVLLNTAVLGSRSEGDSSWQEIPPVLSLNAVVSAASRVKCIESIAHSALTRLSQLLVMMGRAKVDGFESEIVLVVSSVVDALRSTSKPDSDPWVADALKLVQTIASNPRYTNDLYELFVKEPSSDPLPSVNTNSSQRVFRVMVDALGVNSPTEDWSCWDAAVRDELSDAATDESDFATLLHAPGQASYEAALAEEERRSVRRRATRVALDLKVTQAAKRLKQDETCRLVEVLAEGERDRRHSEQEWGRILEGLASERGPWGVNNGEGAADGRRVYWMMDDSEDHLRRRQKLSRNPLGSDHAGAAQNSCENRDKEVPLSARKKSRVNESRLWKDLRRFQKKSDMVVDSSSEEEEEEEEEGGLSPKTSSGPSSERRSKKKRNRKRKNADESVNSEPDDREEDGSVELEEVTGEAKLFNEPVELLMRAPLVVTPGILEVTKERIRFTRIDDEEEEEKTNNGWTQNSIHGASGAAEEGGSYKWAVSHVDARTWRTCDVVKLAYRHYSLRFVAMEVFFADHSVVMFNCKSSAMCKKLHDAVSRCKPPYLVPQPDSPRKVLAQTSIQGVGLTEAWVQREITNFEYLMALNTIAGRTYNDLAQYPIFPWVLSDYTSSELNLSSRRSFRDLRYPMGIQHGRAREDLQTRYRELESMTEPDDPASAPFHYGACYSNPAFVLWYLLRLEPFTSLHIHLQSGQIDKPDRLFQSLAKTYKGCTNNPTDVKELIPEFFYQPEFLRNENAFELGTTQDGLKLGDVELPPWAKGDPCEFMRLHRLALESEFVSINLHHWVDLIFGYKQRPPHMPNGSAAAVEACNVYRFYHYPDAFNMDEVEAADPLTHEVWMKTANEFGQVPVQLFPKRPHPQRIPLHEADIIWPVASVVPGAGTCLHNQPEPERPKFLLSYPPRQVASCAVILVAELSGGAERLVTMDAERVIGYHVKEKRPPDVVPPYKLRIDTQALNLSTSIVRGNHVSGLRSDSFDSSPNKSSRDSVDTGGGAKVMASLSSMGSSSGARERRLAVPFAPLHTSRRVGSSLTAPDSRATHMSRRRQRMSSRDSTGSSDFGAVVSIAVTASDNLADPIFEEGLSDLSGSVDSAGVIGTTDTNDLVSEKRGPSTSEDELGPHLFAVLGNLLFSSKHWDCSFKVTHLETGKLVQSVALHHDVLTCLALVSEGNRSWLVTASCDCTVMVWEVDGDDIQPVSPTPLHTLTGHDDAVTCVAASPQLDLVVSASQDSLIVHTLFHGTYVRTLDMVQPDPQTENQEFSPMNSFDERVTVGNIHWVGISQQGFIITYSLDNMCLCTFSVNGTLLRRQSVAERLHAFLFSDDGKVLLTGGTGRAVVWRWVHDLKLADNDSRVGFDAVVDGSCEQHKVPAFPAPIRSLAMSEHERHLMVGLQNGQVYMLAPDSNYLRKRLQKQLEYLGFY